MTSEKIVKVDLEEIEIEGPRFECCLTCKYWKDPCIDPRENINETNGVHWRYYSEGLCKRYPPVLYEKGTDGEYDSYEKLTTDSFTWCGEYKKDINAKIGVAYHHPSGLLSKLLCAENWRIEKYPIKPELTE